MRKLKRPPRKPNELIKLLISVFLTIASLATGGIGQKSAKKPPKGMALIPAGTFTMGTAPSDIEKLKSLYGVKRDELFEAEIPAHRVRLNAFYIDRYEVTNKEFEKFLSSNREWLPAGMPAKYDNGKYLADWLNGKFPKGAADLPVTNVNWYVAMAYCHWAGKRLPTEAEWEYAARGGLASAEFPWGNEPVEPIRANYGKSGFGKPVRVGSYAPNGYGLYDMAGNVWEFTADEWGKYSAADVENPLAGPNIFATLDFDLITTRRVIRGGSWGGSPINLRVAYRDSHLPNGSQPFVGFRCAQAVSNH
ncbi:MAG TPA: formylglycine-generating enzyme family protein [Pyrinomonadaceae bacterium]|nr:formylglycine-generating enzyme family protein [Pyrinomonadaceae bacterium]